MSEPPPLLTRGEIERHVDACAAALRLPLAPEHREGVLRYFALAAEFAAIVEAVPLTPHDDPAVVFLASPGVQ